MGRKAILKKEKKTKRFDQAYHGSDDLYWCLHHNFKPFFFLYKQSKGNKDDIWRYAVDKLRENLKIFFVIQLPFLLIDHIRKFIFLSLGVTGKRERNKILTWLKLNSSLFFCHLLRLSHWINNHQPGRHDSWNHVFFFHWQICTESLLCPRHWGWHWDYK